ncbi:MULTISPECIES: hypothetical protein [Nostocales]|uniref:hypothetical protein n=1 Tax=Nostocales TaxID=1161 RepID=UPI00029B5AFF|nr:MULTISPECIES: hypothetical protein [Nostocales]AFW94417.1 hypothetical protein ANA_C11650 [Anabaena sp. 90]MTJ19233.1 hypothetical protein [Dolichospermum sp. UHCC 0299]MTJ20344.1 hypothetical protein [Dolichospermum sp. UHCC 0352]MTJ39833.1 hypothetical protein [Dolichospermum sp. UHCC 0406]
MSKILITDIPLFTDIPIKQQEIIVGGTTTDIATDSLTSVPLNPILEAVFNGLELNPGDLTKYLNSWGLNINFPII